MFARHSRANTRFAPTKNTRLMANWYKRLPRPQSLEKDFDGYAQAPRPGKARFEDKLSRVPMKEKKFRNFRMDSIEPRVDS